MAKGIGLIGNFKGKVGNTVGYKLSASNTGNTQGIRVYQPIVRNPKTSAQAEQRAKLAPINATYRALKMIIDRGNEGLPYGNKSRLAWLKQAFKAQKMPWIAKGGVVAFPVGCPLTKGSLAGVNIDAGVGEFFIECRDLSAETSLATIGAVSTAMKAAYPNLQDGDQITVVIVGQIGGTLSSDVFSFVIDTTSAVATAKFTAMAGKISVKSDLYMIGGAVIVSREGANGEHLRSTTSVQINDYTLGQAPYDAASKAAAIESYQNAAGANADWAEESIQ